MRRTQESGETAILQTVFSTRRPCQRPRVNQSESARVAAATAAPSSAPGRQLAVGGERAGDDHRRHRRHRQAGLLDQHVGEHEADAMLAISAPRSIVAVLLRNERNLEGRRPWYPSLSRGRIPWPHSKPWTALSR